MMHLSWFRGFQDQANLGPRTIADQMMVNARYR